MASQQQESGASQPAAAHAGRPFIAVTRTAWFLRGAAVGILICGAANAASYFFRSEDCGNLLSLTPQNREAIGFPLQLWEAENLYKGYFIDLHAFMINAAFALFVAVALGIGALKLRPQLNTLVRQIEQANSSSGSQYRKMRISLGGLFVAMTLAAIGAVGFRYVLAGRPEVVGAIDLIGPWLLIAIAYLPAGLSWQHRVMIVIPSTLALIAAAIGAGARAAPSIPLDKVMLGIFVCWTPQTVFVALLHTGLLALRLRRRQANAP